MKRLLFCSLLLIQSLISFSQTDYAIVNIYRPGRYTAAAVPATIVINDVVIGDLPNASSLQYKVYVIGYLAIEIRYSNPSMIDVGYVIEVERNKVYHYLLKPKLYGTKLIQLDGPITKGVRENKRFAASDIDYDKFRYIYEAPHTSWNETNLMDKWKNSSISPIEGIYESVGSGNPYRLGLVNDIDTYKLIYFKGDEHIWWQEGDVKAIFTKTSDPSVYKTKWYMSDKSLLDGGTTTFDRGGMLVVFGSNQTRYLKVFPSYEDTEDLPSSEWLGAGTGFFLTGSGYIATNYHVIEKATVIEIVCHYLDNTSTFSAKVVLNDKQNDLSILKIEDSLFENIGTIEYNFLTETQDVGSSVFTLGYPLTNIMGSEVKFTDGKISSKSGFQGDITSYQITVPIQPGNSGGPLFDSNGNLIGITSSGINKQIADNANYAIKSNYLKLLVESLSEKIVLPNSTKLQGKPLTEQIKILSKYVVLIKIK